jgi:hypothetical protein
MKQKIQTTFHATRTLPTHSSECNAAYSIQSYLLTHQNFAIVTAHTKYAAFIKRSSLDNLSRRIMH